MDVDALIQLVKEQQAQPAPGQHVDVSISVFRTLPEAERAPALRRFLQATLPPGIDETEFEFAMQKYMSLINRQDQDEYLRGGVSALE